MEVYTITNAAGEPFTDPHYRFVPDMLTIRGFSPALVATKFDYP